MYLLLKYKKITSYVSLYNLNLIFKIL